MESDAATSTGIRATCAILAVAFTLAACGSSTKSATTAPTTAGTAVASSAQSTSVAASTAVATPTTQSTAVPTPTIQTVQTTPTTAVAATTEAPTTAAPTTADVTTTTVSASLNVSVCSLVTADAVSGVLGTPAADAGTERIFDTNYRNCRWSTPDVQGNTSSLQIAVIIRTSPTAPGFSPSSDAGTPQPVAGLGDKATFADKPDPNFEVAELLADKGSFSVAIDLRYGSTPHAAGLQDLAAEIAKQIFAQLGA